jgi:hypothetical protein
MARRAGDVESFVGGRAPHRSSRAVLVPWALAVVCAISGCKLGGDAAFPRTAECSVRVIVRFASEADDALLSELERAHTLELEPLGAITADLRVYTLRAVGSDDECRAAIDRLRRDERVRSVDLDARRELHEEQSNTHGEG